MPTRKSLLFARFLLFGSLMMVLLFVAIGSWMWSVNVRWQFVAAARNGDINTVRAILDRGMDPDIVSHIGGIRAISFAAYSGKTDVVRLLLERGANPTYGLPQAVLKNRMDIVRLLIAHGADVRHWQGYRESPLQFAQEQGNAEIVSVLKAAGAK